ncbi:unnamed protein product, partial [Timema podura]|nr:unnamed protein product [Timema podura]
MNKTKMATPKVAGKAFHPKKRINRKTKLHLVFDGNARREFLTGFHKRKVQRQKKAKEELDHQLREERKRLKQEVGHKK